MTGLIAGTDDNLLARWLTISKGHGKMMRLPWRLPMRLRWLFSPWTTETNVSIDCAFFNIIFYFFAVACIVANRYVKGPRVEICGCVQMAKVFLELLEERSIFQTILLL